MLHHMHNTDRATNQQKQQAWEAKTDKNLVMYLGSVGQTKSDRLFRTHSESN